MEGGPGKVINRLDDEDTDDQDNARNKMISQGDPIEKIIRYFTLIYSNEDYSPLYM